MVIQKYQQTGVSKAKFIACLKSITSFAFNTLPKSKTTQNQLSATAAHSLDNMLTKSLQPSTCCLALVDEGFP